MVLSWSNPDPDKIENLSIQPGFRVLFTSIIIAGEHKWTD